MPNSWKKITILLFLIALALIIIQHAKGPFFGTRSYQLQKTGDKSLADFYQQALELSNSQTPASTTAVFLAVGDIMLSRNVAGMIKKSDDVGLPFKNMAEILKSTNFNFGNLESPITDSNYFNPSGSMVFNAPEKYAEGLKAYNFQVLNLANNHALDQGVKDLDYTIKYLDENKIQHTGAGKNVAGAWQPAIVTSNGIKICFVGASYASINDNGKTTNDYVARISDVEKLKSAIRNSQSLCNFTVVTMHAGTEYTRTPNQAQIDFAHAAIDDGADMVIGGHPHWAQTIERYAPNCPSPIHGEGAPSAPEGQERLKCGNPKYIFYSLGNFVFDQEWSEDTKEGLVLKVTISKQGNCHPGNPSASEGYPGSSSGRKLDSGSGAGMTNTAACLDDLQGQRIPAHLDSVELVPVVIENYSTPRPATSDKSKKILQKIGQIDNIIKP